MVFNKGLSKNRRRLDEVTAAQNRRNRALRGSVRAMNKEAEGLSDKELKKRIEALKKEQETLDDSVKAYDGYLPNIVYSEELQTAALAASKERQEVDAEGNLVTKRTSEEEQRLGVVTAELTALTNEQTRRKEEKRKATEAEAEAAAAAR